MIRQEHPVSGNTVEIMQLNKITIRFRPTKGFRMMSRRDRARERRRSTTHRYIAGDDPPQSTLRLSRTVLNGLGCDRISRQFVFQPFPSYVVGLLASILDHVAFVSFCQLLSDLMQQNPRRDGPGPWQLRGSLGGASGR